MPNAYGYCRVSTDRQAQHGDSLTHQNQSIENYFQTHFSQTHDWGGIHQECRGVSAYKRPFHQRPAGKLLAEKLQRGDVIIVDKLDRLFRKMRDFENMIHWVNSMDIRLCVVDLAGISLDTKTPMGMLLLRMLAIYAELESHIRGERIRDVGHVKRMAGKAPMGKLPWYWDVDSEGCLFVPDETIDLAKKAYQLNQAGVGHGDTREILEELYCTNHNKPYRRSAFHNHQISRGAVNRLCNIGSLLAAGVPRDKLIIALRSVQDVPWR